MKKEHEPEPNKVEYYYCPICKKDSARIHTMIYAGTPVHPKKVKVRYFMYCGGCCNCTKPYRTKDKLIHKWTHKNYTRILVHSYD